MRSSTERTCLPLNLIVSAPSPSTRASVSTLIVLPAMRVALLLERGRGGVERLEDAREVRLARAEALPFGGDGRGVGSLARAEAAVAAARVRRAERAAARVRDRPETRRSEDQDAHVP